MLPASPAPTDPQKLTKGDGTSDSFDASALRDENLLVDLRFGDRAHRVERRTDFGHALGGSAQIEFGLVFAAHAAQE